MENNFLLLVLFSAVCAVISFVIWYMEIWNQQKRAKVLISFIFIWVFSFIGIVFADKVNTIRSKNKSCDCVTH